MKDLILLLILLLSMPLFAKELTVKTDSEVDLPLHTRADFPNVYVPGAIQIEKNGIIAAPVGDYRLQSPIIKVKINGKGPFNFMFDSGFSQSMISHSLAKKLKLPENGKKKINAVTPNQMVKVYQTSYYAEKVQISDITLNDYNFIVTSNFEDEVDDFKDLRIDGVLSANAFYPMLISIDYKSEKLQVHEGALEKGQKHVNPYPLKRRIPTLRVKIIFDKLKREIEQDMTVDTGCYAYIYVNACDIPEMTKFKGKENLLKYDYQGTQNNEYFAQLYGKIQPIPDYSIKSPYITFSRSNCKIKNTHGLLCRKFFEKHKVTVDLVNYLVKVQPY